MPGDRLFAERFLIFQAEAGPSGSTFEYDESRSISLDERGHPAVEGAPARWASTVTDVRGPASDTD